MTHHRDPDRGEPDLDDLIHALAEDDRQATAPAHLRAGVLLAWDAHHATVVGAGRAPRSWLPQVAGLAAAAVVVLAWLAAQFVSGRLPGAAPVRSDAPALRATPSDSAMTTLMAEPPFDTESLQIVRVRMPRQQLRAFGVALVDPEVAGDVEVDVLVGDDGVPRSIQGVRPVTGARERKP